MILWDFSLFDSHSNVPSFNFSNTIIEIIVCLSLLPQSSFFSHDFNHWNCFSVLFTDHFCNKNTMRILQYFLASKLLNSVDNAQHAPCFRSDVQCHAGFFLLFARIIPYTKDNYRLLINRLFLLPLLKHRSIVYGRIELQVSIIFWWFKVSISQISW